MKKATVILIISILAITLLVSCSSSAYEPGYARSDSSTGSMLNMSGGGGGGSAPSAAPGGSSGGAPAPDSPAMPSSPGSGSSGSGLIPITSSFNDSEFAEKIIYTVNADIETLHYDLTIEQVYEIMTFNGAFIESADIGGRRLEQTFHGVQTLRQARFSLRVPKNRLNAVTASLDDLGNVTSLRSDAQNITAQFSDSQSRLNSLRTQEERLLDMLARSDSVEDMLTIEERLATTRYQIESLTSSLRNWQNQVDYSTLNLYIREVEEYTEPEPEPEEEVPELTYWQQIGEGLKASAISVANFFKALFKWFAINLPVLAVIAVIVVVVLVVLKFSLRRGTRKSRKEDPNNTDR